MTSEFVSTRNGVSISLPTATMQAFIGHRIGLVMDSIDQ